MIELSVILLSWNSEKHIPDCVNSLLAAIAHLDSEIIVVDNGSKDSSLDLLEKYASDRFKIIRNTENRGVAPSRNQALKLVSGQYVLILDIDTVVNREAIDALITAMNNDSQIGICGCKLQSSTGEVQLSCRRLPSIRYKIFNILEARGINIKANKSQFYSDEMLLNNAFEVEYLIGACQLVRKTALDQVGFLDEHIFYGPEDADFCLRMKQHNWKVVYLPYASIIHHYQQISNKKLFSKHSMLHAKALMYYFLKHRSL